MDDLISDNATTSEETSLRDDLEAAWDTASEETSETPTETPEATDEVKDEVPADDKVEEVEVKTEDKPGKAPQSWTPAMREKFGDLPEEVQAEIMRVEGAAGKQFRETAQERQIANNFKQAVQPYEALIKELGVSPYQAVQETFELASRLKNGNPRQKAEVIAALYEQYDIDLNELDEVLSAKISAPKPTSTEQALLQKLDALERKLQAPAPTQANTQNPVNNEIAEFANDPKNEFFNEVKKDMAMLLQTGNATSLKDAYTKACKLSDEVTKVIEDRKAKDTQRTTAAKATVKSQSPKGNSKAVPEMSLRETLSKAYDETFGE